MSINVTYTCILIPPHTHKLLRICTRFLWRMCVIGQALPFAGGEIRIALL